MRTEDLIKVEEFCLHHRVDVSFIVLLNEHGLVELITIEETHYVQPQQLPHIEKMARLHYDLDVNLEGIEVIANLLHQLEKMHQETVVLRNRLQRYEEDLGSGI